MGQDLRELVRQVYSHVAAAPSAEHPFKVGRELARRAGYPEEWLSRMPPECVDSFAGVSCVPCFAEAGRQDRVLDLGCGAGLDALLFSKRAASVLAVDFSEAMLARARASAEAAGVRNIEFLKGDAERIPAADASVDVAGVNGIFNLNTSRAEIFRELARVVRPGGAVFSAELILKGPLPPDVKPSPDDWFA